MALKLGERFLLLKACIVRRTPKNSWITNDLLMKALSEDQELTRTKTPDYYYNDALNNVGEELALAIEDGLIEMSSVKKNAPISYRRTPLGDVFLKSLEPRLADVLDQMPMSGEDLLDFLGLL